MQKKRGWFPLKVTEYVASPSSDQSSYDTYDLIGTGLSVSVRKTAAFLFQNSETEIARLLGIDVDNSLNGALKRLRKSLRTNIDNNGGGHDEYIDAVTLREEVSRNYDEVAGEFDIAGLQDDHKTLAFIGDTVQTFTFVPVIVKLDMLLKTCRRAGLMKNELRAKRVTQRQCIDANDKKRKYKKEALGMKSTYNDWLESAANRIDLVDLLLSSAPSHALDVLWAYLKIISKDEQVNMPGVDRGIMLKVSASFYPDLANLEQHESSCERKYRQCVLELLGNSENMAQNKGKHHTKSKKKYAMRKYRAARTYTALTYAKMWLDPNKERSKHLLRYLQKMVDKDEEKRKSKNQAQTERVRQKSVAKANEKRFAGGRYNIGELKNAGMALLAKQVKG